MQTHRHIAKRKALFWQVGAVALLAAAGAAVALPQIRSLFAPQAHKNSAEKTDLVKPAPTDYTQLALDAGNRGAKEAGSAVTAVAPAPEQVASTGPTAPPPPAPVLPTDWAYLGSIITPSKRSALVRVDGQQQIYSVGATHGDAKLVTIESAFIEVETGTEKKKIALSERTLLAPTDPPKHPVAFRQPPAMGMAGAGGPMNFNASSRAAANTALNQPATTFEQARMAAIAANEAAARARQASEVPGMMPIESIDPGQLEAAAKYLSDPSIGDDGRMKYLQMLGITKGASMDSALTRLKETGVDMGTEAGKHIMQAVESNSRTKP